jgi:hypothetical protein
MIMMPYGVTLAVAAAHRTCRLLAPHRSRRLRSAAPVTHRHRRWRSLRAYPSFGANEGVKAASIREAQNRAFFTSLCRDTPTIMMSQPSRHEPVTLFP